jgi:Uma2 family endonuclease
MSIAVRKRKTKPPAEDSLWPLVLRTRPAFNLTEARFFELCGLNGDLRLELTAEGELLIMPPAGWEPSHCNAEVTYQVVAWAKQDGTGVVTDSSGGFRLPNGAVRSPDAAWLPKERLEQVPTGQRERFLPPCPDFVIELWSPSDRLSTLHAEMEEYLANGTRLGWLLYPPERRAYVYRPDAPVEQLDNPQTLSGDPVLPGFTLELREVW